jgi:sulfate/thiosulfate transport system substrate-binding protein
MRSIAPLAAVILALAGTAAALGFGRAPRADAARQDTRLTLVAYSTPREAYAKLIPAFQATAAGQGVSFDQSYGASGDQARAILEGLHADVVEFSLEPDMTVLVNKGLVAKTWNKNQYDGIITRSVVVFVVRDGNPKHIRTWQDLIKSGVQVVTPNPFTSGGAKWNIMAAYGAQLRAKKTHKQAVAYLRTLFKDHVVSLDKSAREALQTFAAGRGDVLITYENEALFANKKGQRTDYYIPKATLRIDNPIAVTTNSSDKTKSQAFLKFLYTPAAQKILADNGYRPVVRSVLRDYAFAVRPQMFTMKYLGGWAKVDKRFFDPKSSIMAGIIGNR